MGILLELGTAPVAETRWWDTESSPRAALAEEVPGTSVLASPLPVGHHAGTDLMFPLPGLAAA